MNCPHCHEDLITKDYEHISIFTCKDCGGIWLTPLQLNQIITLHDMQFSENEIEDTLKTAHPGLTDAEVSATLPCPVCSSPMHNENYDYSSGVIVNICSQGHGIWFDKNELEEVQIFMGHWDSEENTHKKELLAKLEDDRKEVAEYEAENTSKLSKLLGHVFQTFEKL